MRYQISHCREAPPLDGNVAAAPWQSAECAEVTSFRPESSAHRPRTLFRLLHSDSGLHLLFCVRDRYVRCARTVFNDPVCRDSCVEFFVQPAGAAGYFNFECNCGGTLLASYITDHRRTPGGFAGCTRLSPAEGAMLSAYHSLPCVIEPERVEAVDWVVQFNVPFALLERYCGPLEHAAGAVWRGNFYKCADESSQPHWAAWSPVDELNFHLPRCFGELCFR